MIKFIYKINLGRIFVIIIENTIISSYTNCHDVRKDVVFMTGTNHDPVTEALLEKSYNEGVTLGMAQGITQGIAQGIAQGEMKILYELVNDNVLTIEEAAKRIHMDPHEFERRMKNPD